MKNNIFSKTYYDLLYWYYKKYKYQNLKKLLQNAKSHDVYYGTWNGKIHYSISNYSNHYSIYIYENYILLFDNKLKIIINNKKNEFIEIVTLSLQIFTKENIDGIKIKKKLKSIFTNNIF